MQLRLAHRTHVSDTLWEYVFAPTASLSWQSGQFIRLAIAHANPDAGGQSRQFTIASPPSSGVLRILTRHGRSTFKQALASLPLGAEASLSEMPAGTFVWQAPERPKILLASGVGITPFLAMLQDPATQLDAAPTTLVYGHARTPLPDAQVLMTLCERYPNFTIISLPERLTPDTIAQLKLPLADALVYAAGVGQITRFWLPPFNLGPKDLKTDEFTGYAAADY